MLKTRLFSIMSTLVCSPLDVLMSIFWFSDLALNSQIIRTLLIIMASPFICISRHHLYGLYLYFQRMGIMLHYYFDWLLQFAGTLNLSIDGYRTLLFTAFNHL